MTVHRSRPQIRPSLALFLGLALAGATVPAADVQSASPGRQEPGTLTKDVGNTAATIRYLLYLPKEYEAGQDKRWPLILFLHGAGERGDDLNQIKAYGPPRLVAEGKEMPFIIVSPQAPEGSRWDPQALDALLDEIVKRYAVDEDRVYLTGLSMGGTGTWRLASAHPERFAAIAPLCGWGDPDMARRIAGIPTWVFHGAKDDIVPLRASQAMVDALRQVGNEARFTIYPEAGHDCWTETYDNPAVFAWFLSHKR